MSAVSRITSTPRLEVEAFTLRTDETHVHFETDHDLMVTCKAATGGGSHAGLVLVQLGIDGYRTHRAQLDLSAFADDDDAVHYNGSQVDALTDAIDALTAARDQLEVMQTVHEARAAERNAFEIGADAQRFGHVD